MNSKPFICTVYTFEKGGFIPSVKLAEWIRFQPPGVSFQLFSESTRAAAQREFPNQPLFIEYTPTTHPAPSK